jgi:hypothetical protein
MAPVYVAGSRGAHAGASASSSPSPAAPPFPSVCEVGVVVGRQKYAYLSRRSRRAMTCLVGGGGGLGL